MGSESNDSNFNFPKVQKVAESFTDAKPWNDGTNNARPCRYMERIGRRLGIVFYEKAPKSNKKEIALINSSDINDFCLHQKVHSQHKLIFKQDWDQFVEFLKFTSRPEEWRTYAFRQRVKQTGCFDVEVDHPNPKCPNPPANPCKPSSIFMQMDNDPELDPEAETPMTDTWVGLFSEHWVYITFQEIQKIISFDERAQEFFEKGLEPTCNCEEIEDKGPGVFSRCKMDKEIHRFCTEIHYEQMIRDFQMEANKRDEEWLLKQREIYEYQ